MTISYYWLLIRILYSFLHEKQGSCFSFLIGDKVYKFTNYLWKTLFGFTMDDVDVDDEVDPLVTDIYTHVNFD